MIRRLSASLPAESIADRAKRIIAAIAVFCIAFFGGALPAFAAITADNARPLDGIAVTAAVQENRQSDDPEVARSQRNEPGHEEQAQAAVAANQVSAPEPAAAPAAEAAPAPEVAPAPPPAPACLNGEYTVQKGDTLSKIAAAIGYRDPQGKPDWQRIYLCNKDLLGDNPNLIRETWVLKLDNPAPEPAPAPEVAPASASVPAPPPPPPPPAPAPAAFGNPLATMIVNSGFGERTLNGKTEFHRGLDLRARTPLPAFAVTDVEVVKAGPASGFGLWVVARANVDGQIVDFVYGHMDGLNGVSVGDKFAPGEQIIVTGSNGGVPPHLHFEVWVGGRDSGAPVDPIAWLNSRGVNL